MCGKKIIPGRTWKSFMNLNGVWLIVLPLKMKESIFYKEKILNFIIFFLIFVFNYSLEMLLNIIFKRNRQ